MALLQPQRHLASLPFDGPRLAFNGARAAFGFDEQFTPHTLADLPIDPAVAYHSIIANHLAADTPGGSDKVVLYTSSHLEGAASEKIIHSGHGLTAHPLAIREVRRILLEHAAAENPSR